MQETEASTSLLPSSASERELSTLKPSFNKLPALFVLPTHLSVDELEEVEALLSRRGATLTYEVSEASVILGAINTVRRAKFELNIRNVHFDIIETTYEKKKVDSEVLLGKRKRERRASSASGESAPGECHFDDQKGHVTVVKLEWLRDCIDQGSLLNYDTYTICTVGQSRPAWLNPKSKAAAPATNSKAQDSGVITGINVTSDGKFEEAQYQGRRFQKSRRTDRVQPRSKPSLRRETTAEHEQSLHNTLPPPPTWVHEGKVYACERVTPADSPNAAFLDLLEQIRLSRILIEDQIGVRAYSTSIASLAAYPYHLSDPREVSRLPGCDQRIEALFREYQREGKLAAAQVIDESPELRVIRDFYNIWGVGAKTAREWYFERGWRDHDDIIQYGWNDLSRVQQIGLKFFDEFELKIPRHEVEHISSVIHDHAMALTDEEMACTIVGGYRRGKLESGDVDIILSHPEEGKTQFFIRQLAGALEHSGWITHILTLAETNSNRDQQTLGLRLDSSKGGFDTLDKALLVWQDPEWPGKQESRAKGLETKNPNVHRRVDIIVSPWRTVGCAIAGWSSGTTFQRDLRRYAKHKHGWKFDSSGVRDRKTGRWIDLERWTDPLKRAKTPLEAEMRVFEGLGLKYRTPSERCTR